VRFSARDGDSSQPNNDLNAVHWMRQALALAQQAQATDEVPVGALIVMQGEILASGFNQTRALSDPTAHAEVLAIRQACAKLGSARLVDAILVCTLEPCAMCVGAMVHARVRTLIYGANEPKTGACGSAFDLLSDPAHNHKIQLQRGVLAQESGALLQHFFASRRGAW
jgi:tRNA(adenine34) deaminase